MTTSAGNRLNETLGRQLRALLIGQAPGSELGTVAVAASVHGAHYLRKSHRRWYFGFWEDVEVVAASCANLAVARILEPVDRRYPELEKKLVRKLLRGSASTESQPDLAPIMETTSDEDLQMAFQATVRTGSVLAALEERRWTNPQVRNLRDGLIRHIRSSEKVRLEERHGGMIVVGLHSDPVPPPMEGVDLISALGSALGRDTAGLVRVLPDVLVPRLRHGGYAYIMDILRARLAWTSGWVVDEPSSGDRGPDEETLWNDIRRHIHGEAREELDRLEARGVLTEIETNHYRSAIIGTVAEVVARGCEFGSPDHVGKSQQAVFRSLAPEASRDEYRHPIRNRIDYLVRRVRRDLGGREDS